MKAQIKFRMPDGNDWYVNKTFNDRQHLDNYMSKVERDKDCFVDEVWYEDDYARYSCENPTCRKEYGGEYNGGYCSDECR